MYGQGGGAEGRGREHTLAAKLAAGNEFLQRMMGGLLPVIPHRLMFTINMFTLNILAAMPAADKEFLAQKAAPHRDFYNVRKVWNNVGIGRVRACVAHSFYMQGTQVGLLWLTPPLLAGGHPYPPLSLHASEASPALHQVQAAQGARRGVKWGHRPHSVGYRRGEVWGL